MAELRRQQEELMAEVRAAEVASMGGGLDSRHPLLIMHHNLKVKRQINQQARNTDRTGITVEPPQQGFF